MPGSDDLIRRLERLSGIRVPVRQRQVFTDQLQQIILYIDRLADVDTSGVEFHHASDQTCAELRPDAEADPFPVDPVFDNAPQILENCFCLPPVRPDAPNGFNPDGGDD